MKNNKSTVMRRVATVCAALFMGALLTLPLEGIAQRRGGSFGGGGRSFGGGGSRSFGGGGSSFGRSSSGSSSFGRSSSGTFGSGSVGRSSSGGSFGRSGSFGSSGGISRSSSYTRGSSTYAYGGRSYPIYGGGAGLGFMAGYSLGYWSSPAWYYYTPFHPAFYVGRPYVADGMVHPGGFNWLNFFIGLAFFIFLIWLVARLFSGNRGPRYVSY